jgi:uncharacterized repeat protein (TIGR02543 family)
MGAITVKYSGSAAPPSSEGEYAIAVDIAEGANFLGTSGLELGTFTIERTEKGKYFNVFFVTNADDEIDPQEVAKGGTVQRPADPQKEGYIFGGWYYNEEFTMLWNFPSDVVLKHLILYARWIDLAVPVYTVTFCSNGGSSVDPQKVKAGDKVIRPADPTKADAKFGGWYADSAFTGLWDFPSDTAGGSIFLYAKWISAAITTYTVTFNTNGGSGVDRQIVEKGDTVMQPANPVKEGYIFGGWYEDPSFVSRWRFGSKLVVHDVTLYAKWREVSLLLDDLSINGEKQKIAGDTIFYEMPCGSSAEEIQISYSVAVVVGERSDIHEKTLSISAAYPFQRDTVIAVTFGGKTTKYTLRLEKHFDFNSVVYTQLGGKLLLVLKNPKGNGGFNFKKAYWQRKVGQDWVPAGGGSEFYHIVRQVDGDNTIRVLLQDDSGAWLSTCPYSLTGTPGEALRAAVYPNPVSLGGVVRIKEDFLSDPSDALEEPYTSLLLLDIQGKVVYTGKPDDLKQGITMPITPGVYHFLLEGKAGRKLLKVAVGKD